MTDVLIMAAGLGTRMKSRRAKVLHEIAGLPLIAHVVRAAAGLAPEAVITVVGHQADEVEAAVRQAFGRVADQGGPVPKLEFVLQAEQRGTGHAVMAARQQLSGRTGALVVLAGDGPMIKPSTLERLVDVQATERNDVTMLSVVMDDPTGYGRIIRDAQGRFVRCVEQKDGTAAELATREVNVSIYCFAVPALLQALTELGSENAQGEYYLTDVPAIIQATGGRVGIMLHDDPAEVEGINTRLEMAEMERRIRDTKLRELMLAGVTIVDPATTYVHQAVEIGPDTVLHPQVIIEGATRIGSNCVVQSWTRLRNAVIEDGVTVRNSCVIEDSLLRSGATVGPFARLRMKTEICENAAIGNFVEVKKSRVGKGSKASHLTYLGDATLGEKVNIGAGTVTCNYDGVNKHETVIEDGVKIGSDTMLVAPVRVGKGSVSGAGSVIIEDVPPDSLVAGVPAKVKKKLR